MGWFEAQTIDAPRSPPLPTYDPKEEPPKWDYKRMSYNLKVEKPVPWTKVGDQPDSPDKPDWRGVIKNNVRALPMPEPYNFGVPVDSRYFWFDTPDYADPFKKLWYATRWFAKAGLILACTRGILQLSPFTFKHNRYLFASTVWPIFSAGIAASTTVMVVANLRDKKDDMWNYAAAGLIFGLVGTKNFTHISVVRNVVLSVPAAIFLKYNAETNGSLLQRFDPRTYRYSLTGWPADNGFFSGDLRFGFRGYVEDEPGRGVRRTY